jgi:REP element-mobilizing transposase RayT
MARRPRHEDADAIHHVFARGNNRGPVFFSDDDRRLFLGLLGREVRTRGWRCLAYCLLGNHYHLLVETPEPSLAAGMQRMHLAYVRTVNARVPRINRLFGDRYGSARKWTDDAVRACLGYIAHNPVEAGLCARAEDWSWSSYGRVIGGRAPHLIDVPRLRTFVPTTDDYPTLVAAAAAAANDAKGHAPCSTTTTSSTSRSPARPTTPASPRRSTASASTTPRPCTPTT